MRVRMKATLSGTRDGEAWPPRGGTVDLTDEEAQHLIRAGIAEDVDDEPEPAQEPEEETATVPDESEKALPASRRSQAKKPTAQ